MDHRGGCCFKAAVMTRHDYLVLSIAVIWLVTTFLVRLSLSIVFMIVGSDIRTSTTAAISECCSHGEDLGR
jgi:hypothetical protein